MYRPLRIAAAVEGPTDSILIEAIIAGILPDHEFEFHTVQPEGSAAFGSSPVDRAGGGWVGIYHWCRQAALEGEGCVSGSSVFRNCDMLVLHVDADVAERRYSDGNIRDADCEDLPCAEPCPPPGTTTDALRSVILKWLGEHGCPGQIVMCTPSKNIEAWLLAAIWPENRLVQRADWECRSNPERQLRALPKARGLEKRPDAYRTQMATVTSSWSRIRNTLTEAARFERELLNKVTDCIEVDQLGSGTRGA